MDIQHLVDRLEDLIDEGRHIWLTKLTMVDEERALEIIDQMRISIPEEVDKANRVINQRERIMAQANEEAARIIDIAKEKAETLIQRDAITQAAQNRAANIIEQARQAADAMRSDAETYVIEVLAEFESHLLKTLNVVRNGITKLQQDREARDAALQAAIAQAQQEVGATPAETIPPMPGAPQADNPASLPLRRVETPAPVEVNVDEAAG